MKDRRSPVKSILLIGPTGSGKTPLGELIEKEGFGGRKCHHFDFGGQLREIGSGKAPPEGFTAEDHLFIRNVLETGALLEREHFYLAKETVTRFLAMRRVGGSDLLVLNGLPRHLEQAEDMGDLVDVRGIVVLKCTARDVCGRIATNAGRDRAGRSDDSLAMIEKKLDLFHSRTTPLIRHYSDAGAAVFSVGVTVSSSPEEVYSKLKSKGLY